MSCKKRTTVTLSLDLSVVVIYFLVWATIAVLYATHVFPLWDVFNANDSEYKNGVNTGVAIGASLLMGLLVVRGLVAKFRHNRDHSKS